MSAQPCVMEEETKFLGRNAAEELEIFFSAGIIVPVAIAIGIVALICIFYKFNFVSDDMEDFVKSGGDKSDEKEFRRFVRDRKFYGNTIIIACIAALVCAYCTFVILYFF